MPRRCSVQPRSARNGASVPRMISSKMAVAISAGSVILMLGAGRPPNSAARLTGMLSPKASSSTTVTSLESERLRSHSFTWRGRASDRLDCLDQLRGHLLRIAVQHARVVEVEQRVLDAGEARALAALDDDDVLGLVGVQDRHPIDRARLVVAGYRID